MPEHRNLKLEDYVMVQINGSGRRYNIFNCKHSALLHDTFYSLLSSVLIPTLNTISNLSDENIITSTIRKVTKKVPPWYR